MQKANAFVLRKYESAFHLLFNFDLLRQSYLTITICCREIQLKSPNWLFGQRKLEESGSAPKVTSHEISKCGDETRLDSFSDLNWLSSADDFSKEDIIQRYFL